MKLKNSLAADLAVTLEDAIEASIGDGDRRSAVLELLAADVGDQRILKSGILADVEVTPDSHTNTLIVSAPAESMELLEALIKQLDSPSAVAQIKVFKIINGDANSLILMLRTLLPSQTGGAAPQLAGAEGEGTLVPVRFSVDTRTNSIIATGSEGDLTIIESLLLRLDAEDVEQRKNVVYSLKNSPAPDVAVAINDFLESQRYRISYYANKMASSVRPEDLALLFGTVEQNQAAIGTYVGAVDGAQQAVANFVDKLPPGQFKLRPVDSNPTTTSSAM